MYKCKIKRRKISMNVLKILELAEKGHKGQFRKDNKTPYINHPIKVCEYLYKLGFTNKKYTEDELSNTDYVYYAVALMHDLLEDTDVTEQQIVDVSNSRIYNLVEKLTFRNNPDNPFAKTEYLLNIVDSFIEGDVAFVIKCIDRICNVYDFIKEGNYKYAKIYFHKADMLWNELYKRKNMYTNLWNEVIKINNSFKGEKK